MAMGDAFLDFDSLDFTLEDLEGLEKHSEKLSSNFYDFDFSTLSIPGDSIQDIFSTDFTDTTNPPTPEQTSTDTTNPPTPETTLESRASKRGFDEKLSFSWSKKPRSKRTSRPVKNTRVVLSVKKRACGHCGTEETPQWRQGPLGPKTLCNACGVRYKSGRLVPEYRPIASPTFDGSRHSNCHKKIIKMRMTMTKKRV